LTFKDGGAFDFHSIFEQIKERVHQAYSEARENGQTGAINATLADVHLEQLPAYESAPAASAVVAPPPVEREPEEERVILSPIPVRPLERDSGVAGVRSLSDESSGTENTAPAPDEPPPGYEEAQAQAVGDALDRRLREEAEREQ